MRIFSPTNAQNAFARLVLRFFLVYLVAVFCCSRLLRWGISLPFLKNAAMLGVIPTVLALCSVFLIIGNAYLMLLAILKGFYDGTVLLEVIHHAGVGSLSFWQFNACFFLLACGLLLFLISLARACLCIHQVRSLLSKGFAFFLLDMMALVIVSLVLYLLWQQLLTALPFI